jgi:hypothetical protein
LQRTKLLQGHTSVNPAGLKRDQLLILEERQRKANERRLQLKQEQHRLWEHARNVRIGTRIPLSMSKIMINQPNVNAGVAIPADGWTCDFEETFLQSVRTWMKSRRPLKVESFHRSLSPQESEGKDAVNMRVANLVCSPIPGNSVAVQGPVNPNPSLHTNTPLLPRKKGAVIVDMCTKSIVK